MNRHFWYSRHGAPAIVRRGLFSLFAIAGLALLTLTPPSRLLAQTSTTPSMRACAVTGQVSLTLAGLPLVTKPIECLNQAEQSTPGTADQTAANVNVPTLQLQLPLLGSIELGNLATIQTPVSHVEYTASPTATTLKANTAASSVQLIGGLANAQNVQEAFTCGLVNGATTPTCTSSSTIDNLTISGQVQALPNPIPPNYSLPVDSSITVTVLGLPTTVGMKGSVTLNAQNTTSTASATRSQHASIRADLSGDLTVVGLGLVKLKVGLSDYADYCANSSRCAKTYD